MIYVEFRAECRKEHVPGAEAHVDWETVIAGTEVPAYLRTQFFPLKPEVFAACSVVTLGEAYQGYRSSTISIAV